MLTHLNNKEVPPKRVVVIGANGFVGGAITDLLVAHGVECLPLGRAEVDLLDQNAAQALADYLRPGDSVVAVSAIAPAKNFDMVIDNLKLTQAMVQALTDRGDDVVHVVNISSDAVFADEPTPLHEGSPKAPDSYHGVMHLAREICFQTDIDQPLAILRPTLIYGAADPHNGYGPNRFRRLAAEGDPIVLFGNGEEQRDHILVDDVAEICRRVVCRQSTGSLNLASGEVVSFMEIAKIISEMADQDVPIIQTERTGPMPHNGYRPFDVSACRAAFPDFSPCPVREGLKRVDELCRKQGES